MRPVTAEDERRGSQTAGHRIARAVPEKCRGLLPDSAVPTMFAHTVELLRAGYWDDELCVIMAFLEVRRLYKPNVVRSW